MISAFQIQLDLVDHPEFGGFKLNLLGSRGANLVGFGLLNLNLPEDG